MQSNHGLLKRSHSTREQLLSDSILNRQEALVNYCYARLRFLRRSLLQASLFVVNHIKCVPSRCMRSPSEYENHTGLPSFLFHPLFQSWRVGKWHPAPKLLQIFSRDHITAAPGPLQVSRESVHSAWRNAAISSFSLSSQKRHPAKSQAVDFCYKTMTGPALHVQREQLQIKKGIIINFHDSLTSVVSNHTFNFTVLIQHQYKRDVEGKTLSLIS